MRGSNKAFFLIFILLTPTLSSRRGSFFLNLMAVTLRVGTQHEPLCGSGRWSVPNWVTTQSVGTIKLEDDIQRSGQ